MTTSIVAKSVLQAPDGSILVVQRSETDVRRPLQWDFPGGVVEKGEDFAAAAAREIFEEVGITIDPKKLQLVYASTESAQGLNICRLFFYGKIEKQQPTLSFEHTDFAWRSIEEAIAKHGYHLQQAVLEYLLDNHLLA